MEETKIDKMKDIKIKLEDINNSQASLIEKVAKVLVELFETPDAELEKSLNDIHTNASANAETSTKMIEDYQMKINVLLNE